MIPSVTANFVFVVIVVCFILMPDGDVPVQRREHHQHSAMVLLKVQELALIQILSSLKEVSRYAQGNVGIYVAMIRLMVGRLKH